MFVKGAQRNLIVGIVSIALLTAVLFAQQATQQNAANHRTWGDYLGGNDSSHYSSLDQINRTNVNQLELAWQYETGDRTSYGVNPLVVDSLIYVIAKNNSVVALNASTGQEVWTYDAGVPTGRHRGLNYWENRDRSDRRILMTYGDKLQAINATTGQLIDSFGDHGSVNLKEGLDVDPAMVNRIQSGTPGRVFENRIILGSATGEAYISPPGHLRAYNVITGAREWIFHTIPHPGEFGYDTWPKDAWKYIGGTNTWGEITIDEKRGIAYFPLGSPTYDFYGADRKGDGLFGNCLLALDARTGKYLWHFQLVHHDLWDYDAVAAPQLITIRHEGKDIDAVAQAGKQGFLYVFDRVTGKPIWPIEERQVPKSDMPGEAASPTQPYPTAPPPFARQKFTADDINPFILTTEQRSRWKDRILSARNEGLYTPPSLRETVQMPGNNGGANFWGTAADLLTGTVYVVSKDVPAMLKMLENPPGNAAAAANANLSTAQRGRVVFDANCQICHGADAKGEGVAPSLFGVLERRGADQTKQFITRGEGEMPGFALNEQSMADLVNFLSDPAAVPRGGTGRGPRAEVPYPKGVDVPPARYYTGYGLEPRIIGPPWSQLTAYDLNRGIIKWQIPYGDAAQAGPSDTPRGTIFQRSGIAVTAGGLIFFAGNDPVMHILDKDTGKELRSIKLPNGVQGVPIVYEVDGREYVAFCATGGEDVGNSQRALPHVYVAFALPSSALDQKK